MQSKHLLYTALVLTTVLQGDARGDGSLHYARQASAMLGPSLWKKVIQIDNSSTESRYPRTLGAVVFEMGGILWFYTATDGTQSLSLRRNHALEDEQNLGPLLTHIDPGFSRWQYDSIPPSPDESGSVPPNACFIQSIALLRHRLLAGLGAENARLLSYYVTFPTGIRGHTVLYIESGKRQVIIDPLRDRKALAVRSANPADPLCVAYCIRHDVASARWVPIDPNDFPVGRTESAHFAND
jgi:hypothetical protein